MSSVPSSPRLGVCFARELPAPFLFEVVPRLESSGVDELWVIEDCFYTSGISLAAAALVRSERLGVGIGIAPAVARTAAITAMEFATLAQLAPGRFAAGIGHGVQSWMGQMGVRPRSPVTALTEVLIAVRGLLHGDELDVHGEYVTLDHVRLDPPPATPPSVLAGVRGPRSLAVAGQHADGLVLAELTGPTALRDAITVAAPSGPFEVVVYTVVAIDQDRRAARRSMAPVIAQMLDNPPEGLRNAPFFDDLVAVAHPEAGRTDLDAVVAMPDDWWLELGAVGTPDDALAHIDALGGAGATTVSLFLPPEVRSASAELDHIIELVTTA